MHALLLQAFLRGTCLSGFPFFTSDERLRSVIRPVQFALEDFSADEAVHFAGNGVSVPLLGCLLGSALVLATAKDEADEHPADALPANISC